MSAVLLGQQKQLENPALIRLVSRCYSCRKKRDKPVDPANWLSEVMQWERKHPAALGHITEFSTPQRIIPVGFDDSAFEKTGKAPWWLEDNRWSHNANIKLALAASAAYTITLASLATSSTWLTGRESDSVSNASNLYLEYGIGGKITTGTTPTIDTEIRIYVVGSTNDTPSWPDVFDGTDSAETVTNAELLAAMALFASLTSSATSNIAVPIPFGGISYLFNGVLPTAHVLYVAHATAVNLNSTGGNHVISGTGAYATAV